MPAVLPAIAGFAASSFLGGSVAAFTGLASLGTFGTIAAGAITGAVAGAVVGGLQSAVMGGDIGEGILYGAVGGAVGGSLAGAFNVGSFAKLGTVTESGAYQFSPVTVKGTTYSQSLIPSAETESGLMQSTLVSSGEGAGGIGGLSLGESMLAVQAGKGLLSGFGDDDGGPTWEEQQAATKEQMELENKYALEQIAASQPDDPRLAIARLQAEQSERESIRNAEIARENIASEESMLADQLAQQQAELNKPYEEAAAKRARILETATGLTLARKDSEGTPMTTQEDIIVGQTPTYQEATA